MNKYDYQEIASLTKAVKPKNNGATNASVDINRFESIDFARGVVMIIMALDHVRIYLHFDSQLFSPNDLQQTTPAIFITRFITHLCAPTFILLAGTSAYLVAQRKSLKATSFYLITRGLGLIVLQVTIIQFGWTFDPALHYTSSNIISTIGVCMIVLAALIHLRLKTILVIGLIIVFGHNALDTISFSSGSIGDVLWSLLHVKKLYLLDHGYSFRIRYPILPWVGVMALGYCLGSLYDQRYNAAERKRTLLQIGMASVILFFIGRWINVYGDLAPWSTQSTPVTTVLSFFNVEKYPPSLFFLCLMLGLSMVFLGILEGKKTGLWRPIIIFGKVPLFYYVVHIYLIHVLTGVAVIWAGYSWQTIIFTTPDTPTSLLLRGKFGFSLTEVYIFWMAIILLLYPVCHYWYDIKIRNKGKWWTSYVQTNVMAPNKHAQSNQFTQKIRS